MSFIDDIQIELDKRKKSNIFSPESSPGKPISALPDTETLYRTTGIKKELVDTGTSGDGDYVPEFKMIGQYPEIPGIYQREGFSPVIKENVSPEKLKTEKANNLYQRIIGLEDIIAKSTGEKAKTAMRMRDKAVKELQAEQRMIDRNPREMQPDANPAVKGLHALNYILQGAAFNKKERALSEEGGQAAYKKSVAGKEGLPTAYNDLPEQEKAKYREQFFKPTYEKLKSQRTAGNEKAIELAKSEAERDARIVANESMQRYETQDVGANEQSNEWQKRYDDAYEKILAEKIKSISIAPQTGIEDTSAGALIDPYRGTTSARDIIVKQSAFADEPGIQGALGKGAKFLRDTPVVKTLAPLAADLLADITVLIPPLKLAKMGVGAAVKSAGAVKTGEAISKFSARESLSGIKDALNNAIETGVKNDNKIAQAIYDLRKMDVTYADHAIDETLLKQPVPVDTKGVPLYTDTQWKFIKDEVLKPALKDYRNEKAFRESQKTKEFSEYAKDMFGEDNPWKKLPEETKNDVVFAFENYYDPQKRLDDINMQFENAKLGKEVSFPPVESSPYKNPAIEELINKFPPEGKQSLEAMLRISQDDLANSIANKTIAQDKVLPNHLRHIDLEDTRATTARRQFQGTQDEIKAYEAQQKALGDIVTPELDTELDAVKALYGIGEKPGITDARVFGIATTPEYKRLSATVAPKAKVSDVFQLQGRSVDEAVESIKGIEGIPNKAKEEMQALLKDSYSSAGELEKGSFADRVQNLDMTFGEVGDFVQNLTAHNKRMAKVPERYRPDVPLSVFQTSMIENNNVARKQFFDNIAEIKGNGMVEKMPSPSALAAMKSQAEALKETSSDAAKKLFDEYDAYKKEIKKLEESGMVLYEPAATIVPKKGYHEATKVVGRPVSTEKNVAYYVNKKYADAMDNYTRNVRGALGTVSAITSMFKASALALNTSVGKFLLNNATSGIASTAQVAKNPVSFARAYKDATRALFKDNPGKIYIGNKAYDGKELHDLFERNGGGGSISRDVFANNALAAQQIHGFEGGVKEFLDPRTSPVAKEMFAINEGIEKMNRFATFLAFMQRNPNATIKRGVAETIKKHYNYAGMQVDARELGSKRAVPFLTFTANATKQLLTDYDNLAQLNAIVRGVQGQDRTKPSWGGERSENYFRQDYSPTTLHMGNKTLDIARGLSANAPLSMAQQGHGDLGRFLGAFAQNLSPLFATPLKYVGNIDPYKMATEPYTTGLNNDRNQPTTLFGAQLDAGNPVGIGAKAILENAPYGQFIQGMSKIQDQTTGLDIPTSIQQIATGKGATNLPKTKSQFTDKFEPQQLLVQNPKRASSESQIAFNSQKVFSDKMANHTKAINNLIKKIEGRTGEPKPIEQGTPDLKTIPPQDAENLYNKIISDANKLYRDATETMAIQQSALRNAEGRVKILEGLKTSSEFAPLMKVRKERDDIKENIKTLGTDIEKLKLQRQYAETQLKKVSR